MSRSTDRELARLNRVEKKTRSTDISSGLTYGDGHGDIVLGAQSDEEFALKAGVLSGREGAVEGDSANPTHWTAGITHGDPRDNAERAAREADAVARGSALVERENRDRNELAMYRDAELLAYAAEAVNLAAADRWSDSQMNAQAAQYWRALSTEQRALLVHEGDITEYDADVLHQQVWPSIERAQAEHNVEQTRVASEMQKGLALMRIKSERGIEDDATWTEHAKAVFARAREQGIDLADDRMGSQAFEDQFRAAEVVLAEDRRADAEARFKVDLLNTETTNVSEGIRVLGANGWQSTIEGGPVEVKPNYERAAARVLGGGNGDPMHDDANSIRAGILGASAPSEDREWRQAQETAGKLFSAAERERIAQKLGER
jgi:hypothetical protein